MKALLVFLLLLSGCAVQKLDMGEYGKIVTAITSISINDCINETDLKSKLTNFSSQMEYLSLYEGGLPNNTDTAKMLNGVRDETTRFQNIITTSNSVSVVYCKYKIEGMRHTLSLVLEAEGRKSQ